MLKCRVYLAQRQNLAQGTICIWSNPPTVGANTSCIAVERARLNLDALRSCTLLSLRTKKYRLNQVESESELVEWVGAVFGDKRETALGTWLLDANVPNANANQQTKPRSKVMHWYNCSREIAGLPPRWPSCFTQGRSDSRTLSLTGCTCTYSTGIKDPRNGHTTMASALAWNDAARRFTSKTVK